MQRLTISLDDETVRALDQFMRAHGYSNRSEAMRDLIRAALRDHDLAMGGDGRCVAVVSYVFNHHERDLGKRLLVTQHAHHDLGVATLHAHLDPVHCLEVTVLRGKAGEVRAHADRLIRERGVRFGGVNLLPTPEARGMRRSK